MLKAANGKICIPELKPLTETSAMYSYIVQLWSKKEKYIVNSADLYRGSGGWVPEWAYVWDFVRRRTNIEQLFIYVCIKNVFYLIY